MTTSVAFHITESRLWAVTEDKAWEGVAAGRPPTTPDVADAGIARLDDSVMRYLDGDWIATTDRMVAVGDALAGLFAHVSAQLGLETPVELATASYPTHWGSPRRGMLQSALRTIARDTSLVPVAVNAASAAINLGEAARSLRAVVVEVDELATCATSVTSDASGWHVESCELEPLVGSSGGRAETDFPSDATKLVGEVAQGRPLDAVLITGSIAPQDVDAVRLQLAEAFSARLDVQVVPGDVQARTLLHASEPAAPVERPATWPRPSVTRKAPAQWLEPRAARHNAGALTRQPAMVAAVGAATIVAVVAGVLWWRSGSPDNTAAVAAPSRFPASVTARSTTSVASSSAGRPSPSQAPVRFGMVRIVVPPGWIQQPSSGPSSSDGGRVQWVPTDGSKKRIVLVQNVLQPGTGYDGVAAQLEAERAERSDPSTIGPIERGASFGGRTGLSYKEFPDGKSQVDWHVMVEHDVQVSVGCQFLAGEWGAISEDCERFVRNVVIEP